MKAVLFYLLQVIVSSGILYGYYHFFLRNKKFHQYNRYYLLIATVASLIIPFLKIPVYFSSQEDIPAIYKVLNEVRVTNANNGASPAGISWQELFFITYGIVVFIIILRLIISIRKILIIMRRNESVVVDNLVFINTNENGMPFSFMNWLFWNNAIAPGSDEGQKILLHETFHIRQRHTIDILYLEFLAAFFWINPFFLRIKKEIKAIHEFSADEFAMSNGNAAGYAELLLQCAFQTTQKLVHPFFHNQIKRRIAMITNISKTKHQYLRKAMVLPVIFITISIVAANCKSKDTHNEIEQQKVDTKTTKIEQSATAESIDKVYEKLEIEPAFQNGDAGWREFLTKNLNANVPVDNGAPEGEYTCWVQFIVDKEGHLSDIKTLTNHGYGMEQEVMRILKLSPDWIPGSNNGVSVKAYRKQPITFVIQTE